MIDARFRIRLPPDLYITDLSEAFPDATFRLLSGVRSGATAKELGEVLTRTPESVAAAFREHEAVGVYEMLERPTTGSSRRTRRPTLTSTPSSSPEGSRLSFRSKFGTDSTSST